MLTLLVLEARPLQFHRKHRQIQILIRQVAHVGRVALIGRGLVHVHDHDIRLSGEPVTSGTVLAMQPPAVGRIATQLAPGTVTVTTPSPSGVTGTIEAADKVKAASHSGADKLDSPLSVRIFDARGRLIRELYRIEAEIDSGGMATVFRAHDLRHDRTVAIKVLRPELAEAGAERLWRLAPGAGHLVHMPSHIFRRIGRYNDASQSNQDAIAADEDYIVQCRAQGVYPLAYYPHNIHFMAWSAMPWDI